jgi:pyruvate kinase
MDDGLLQFKVISSSEREVLVETVYGGTLKSNKGINLPGVSVSAPSLTEKDKEDLICSASRTISIMSHYLSFDLRRMSFS